MNSGVGYKFSLNLLSYKPPQVSQPGEQLNRIAIPSVTTIFSEKFASDELKIPAGDPFPTFSSASRFLEENRLPRTLAEVRLVLYKISGTKSSTKASGKRSLYSADDNKTIAASLGLDTGGRTQSKKEVAAKIHAEVLNYFGEE